MKAQISRFFTATAFAAAVLCVASALHSFSAFAESEVTKEMVETTREKAKSGNASAQYTLGVIYSKGRGVTKNKREAVRWYRKAAEQGHALAQNNLGLAYKDQYSREAVRWYRKAAEQGLALAQYNLGLAYKNGQGVAQDERKATLWFRKAAEQGNASAQTMLGFSYGIGQGVITDERESFIWLSIAQANGNERAAKGMRVFDDQPRSVILSARKEAEQRMEEIDRRKEQHDKKFGL